MSIFSLLKQQYRSRFLTALRAGRRRRGATGAVASESLEDRALLSAVSFNSATGNAVFNADADEANVLRVSSPDADTVVVISQIAVGGILLDDPITLQGDAVGNPAYSLNADGSVLTIDVTAAGSETTLIQLNTFEEADQIFVLSTTAVTPIDVNGGSDDDLVVIGTANTLDATLGNVSFDGGSGNDSLDLLDFDSTDADTILLTSTSIVGIAPANIDYTSIEDLLIDAADLAPVTLDVLSTSAGTDTIVDLTFDDANGVPIPSIVTLGNTTAAFGSSSGNMNGIAGDLELETNSGSLVLQLDDQGDSTGDNAVVSETTITGFSAGTISYPADTNFAGLVIESGSGGDTVNLQNAPTGVEVDSGAGNDFLIGSANADTITGGAGDDTINSGAGNDFVDGDFGDDEINAGDGNDTVLGFFGNDVIFGGNGADNLSGEGGEDTIVGNDGDDMIDGGDSDDSIGGGAGEDTINGGFGDDSINGSSGSDLLLGDNGEDTIIGGRGQDVIAGGDGDDVLRGGSGRDTFTWEIGQGDDDVNGGGPPGLSQGGVDTQIVLGTLEGETYVIDELNNETVVQVSGEVLTLGPGVEQVEILAAGGDDEIIVNDVSDSDIQRVVVNGDAGADRIDATQLVGAVASLTGGSGPDVLFGSDAGDTLLGGAGNDSIIGGGGDDSIMGSQGADQIVWNSGDDDDTINGGNGSDLLIVNATSGADTFVIGSEAFGTQTFLTNTGVGMLDFMGVDTLELNAMAGPDNVIVEDLTGSDLTNINADLAQGADTFDGSGSVAPVSMRVLGGIGNDQIATGPGTDFLRGAFGDDTLSSGGGQDQVIGDEGEDIINGGAGNDSLNGGGGDDVVLGRSGSDLIMGGGGNDRIEGDEGNDIIIGGAGQDQIEAGDGDDIVSAGNGADVVSGGQGSDILIGGNGGDVIGGNGGQDILVAGTVSLNISELQQIQTEWLSGRDYVERVQNISNVDDGTVIPPSQQDPTRLNGDIHLLPITSERTVDDDTSVDTLNGGAARDLFFSDFDTDFETDAEEDDVINGRVPNEMNIDIR